MGWETPKTDWHGESVNGVYMGDYFNAEDFNRIKNNLEYLRNIAVTLYPTFAIHDLGADRLPGDYFYADEINKLESNLGTIGHYTFKQENLAIPIYRDNGSTIGFAELNRLEKAILDLYKKLTNQYEGRRTLTWNFGMKEAL